jgi:hypothetical protein
MKDNRQYKNIVTKTFDLNYLFLDVNTMKLNYYVALLFYYL